MTAPFAAIPAAADWAHVFLTPGGLYCTTTPTVITTILGSCISVCLWDRIQRIGGMNHYVLPAATVDSGSARYGDVSLERLIEEMKALGARSRFLVAKVFGGATVLPMGESAQTVGARNLEMALRILGQHRVTVAAHRTGGENGQMIKFNTYTGQVAVRKLDPSKPV